MGKLAAVKFKTGEACPFFMAATLKVQFNFKKESDGVCRTLVPGDVTSIFKPKNMDTIQACEKAMMSARKIAERLDDVTDEEKLYELGMYDCRLVLFMANKLKENDQKEYATIDSISQDRTWMINLADIQQYTPERAVSWALHRICVKSAAALKLEECWALQRIM